MKLNKYIIIEVDEYKLPVLSKAPGKNKVVYVSKNLFPRNKKNALVRPDFESFKDEKKFNEVLSYWKKLREMIVKEFARNERNKTDELFERGEYNLSVIEAIRQFEIKLRTTLMGEQSLQEVVPLSALIRKAFSQEMIPKEKISAIHWAIYQRNKVFAVRYPKFK